MLLKIAHSVSLHAIFKIRNVTFGHSVKMLKWHATFIATCH